MDKESIKAIVDAIQSKKTSTKMKKSSLLRIIAIAVAATAAVCGIAYAVYRYFTPDYLEDFEDDDFEDDFDAFFEDEDKVVPIREEEPEEAPLDEPENEPEE